MVCCKAKAYLIVRVPVNSAGRSCEGDRPCSAPEALALAVLHPPSQLVADGYHLCHELIMSGAPT